MSTGLKETTLTQQEFEDAMREAFAKKNPELKGQEYAIVVNYDNFREKVSKVTAQHV